MSLEGYYHTMLIVWCKKENLSPDPNKKKKQILNPSDSKNVGFVYQNRTMNEPIQPSKNSEIKHPPI